MSDKPVAILVLGMHRSGTSALTRVLNLCGVELGSRLMPAAEGNNELGFWEHLDAVDLHERALFQLGRSWSDTRSMPAGWLDSPLAAAAVERIKALARDEFARSPLWAVKDPRACRFVPLWTKALAELGIELKLLFMLRHPDEVSASLARRDGVSASESGLLLLNHFFEAAQASAGHARCAVTYQSLMEDWRGCMQQIARELTIELPGLEAAAAQIGQFLDRGARNHNAVEDEDRLRETLSGRVYLAARKSEDAQQFWSSVATLSDTWELYQRDLLPNLNELQDMLAVRDTLERQGRAPAVSATLDQDSTPLARLQFRMIAGLQEGMGKLGQASADLGAMVRIGSESALGASAEIGAGVTALKESLFTLQQGQSGLDRIAAELGVSARAQQHQLGEVLTETDALRRHMDDVAGRQSAYWQEFAQRNDERLNHLEQQAQDAAAAAQARSQHLDGRLDALARQIEAMAAREQQVQEARWSRRLRRLLSGK